MRRQARLHRGPRTVVGYHGCARETAERILAGEPFLVSRNRYDWLGEGAYFWEYGPFRAREWAEQRFGAEAAVLEATVTLGRCLNLLDVEHLTRLRDAYERAVQDASARGTAIPENMASGRHDRDRFIVEIVCALQLAAGNLPFQTVRACFPEGDPAFPGSRILSHTHVQIAVRDDSCISRVRLVTFG